MPTVPLRDRPAWQALQRHHAQIEGRHPRELFADDPGRGERMCAQAAGLYLDHSKNRITDETLRLPMRLARESEVEQRRDMMFSGEPINTSEQSLGLGEDVRAQDVMVRLGHDSSTNALIRHYRRLKQTQRHRLGGSWQRTDPCNWA